MSNDTKPQRALFIETPQKLEDTINISITLRKSGEMSLIVTPEDTKLEEIAKILSSALNEIVNTL
jgi:hypothetical protein